MRTERREKGLTATRTFSSRPSTESRSYLSRRHILRVSPPCFSPRYSTSIRLERGRRQRLVRQLPELLPVIGGGYLPPIFSRALSSRAFSSGRRVAPAPIFKNLF